MLAIFLQLSRTFFHLRSSTRSDEKMLQLSVTIFLLPLDSKPVLCAMEFLKIQIKKQEHSFYFIYDMYESVVCVSNAERPFDKCLLFHFLSRCEILRVESKAYKVQNDLILKLQF